VGVEGLVRTVLAPLVDLLLAYSTVLEHPNVVLIMNHDRCREPVSLVPSRRVRCDLLQDGIRHDFGVFRLIVDAPHDTVNAIATHRLNPSE
jgi:hypothetical protein